MTPAVAIHLSFAVIALALGAVILRRAKGTRSHRRLGRYWVAAMSIVAVSSLWIPRFLTPSWIHGFTLLTAISLPSAILAIRRGRLRAHRACMVGCYIGLVGAGLGALAPSRLVGNSLLSALGLR